MSPVHVPTSPQPVSTLIPYTSLFRSRLGRTGRRPGSRRNTTFLATDQGGLLAAAAILLLWRRGFVEDVAAPPHPRHLAAQQLLRSEEHTSELQSREKLVCRLLLENKS